jgi:hypothetical protein
LLVEFQDARSALVMLLLAAFNDAAYNLRDAPVGPLYERFLGWCFGRGHATND